MEIVAIVLLAIGIVGIVASLFNYPFFGSAWKEDKTTFDKIVLVLMLVLLIYLLSRVAF